LVAAPAFMRGRSASALRDSVALNDALYRWAFIRKAVDPALMPRKPPPFV